MFTKNKTAVFYDHHYTKFSPKKKSELNTMGLYFIDEEIGDTMQ